MRTPHRTAKKLTIKDTMPPINRVLGLRDLVAAAMEMEKLEGGIEVIDEIGIRSLGPGVDVALDANEATISALKKHTEVIKTLR